jgi:hypothetical protein
VDAFLSNSAQIIHTKRLSGQKLARMAGISYRTFLRAQRGEPVKPDVIVRIADALKVAPHVVAQDVFTPPLDPRSITPPRISHERAYGRNSKAEVA